MTQSENIIQKFGGIRHLAKALGHANPSTVQGWKERGRVPQWHHEQILRCATKLKIDMTERDFSVVAPAE